MKIDKEKILRKIEDVLGSEGKPVESSDIYYTIEKTEKAVMEKVFEEIDKLKFIELVDGTYEHVVSVEDLKKQLSGDRE